MNSDTEDLHDSKFPGNSAAFAELKAYPKQGAIIGFTGAGISIPKFPVWTNLLSGLLDDAIDEGLISNTDRDEYKTQIASDPLESATSLEEAFTKSVFRSRLAKFFSNPDGRATGCQAAIADLNMRGILTLNYDNGHEAAYAAKTGRNPNVGRSQDQPVLTRWVQGEAFSNSDPPILHFHGIADDPDNMILTSDDYDRFYATSLPSSLITQLWRSSRLLVIGFGFADPFLTRIAEHTLRSIPSDVRHFALIGRRANDPISALTRRQFARKYRLVPIFYPIETSNNAEHVATEDHSALVNLLLSLGRLTADQGTGAIATEPVGASQKRNLSATVKVDEYDDARKNLERDLFITPAGRSLYVEPHLVRPADNSFGATVIQGHPVTLEEIIRDADSYVIAARPEYGGTTVARRLVMEFAAAGGEAILRDAATLPNYKRKLIEVFSYVAIAAASSYPS